jgi:hypothetical protein
MNSLNASAIGSLLVQLVTGLVEGSGLFFKIDPQDLIVQEILGLELLVQTVEFFFYLYLVYLIVGKKVTSVVTSHRYIDWVITTPTMLVSFALFFKYLREPQRNIRLAESAREEQSNLIKLVIANTLMLLLGFLAELSIIPTGAGVVLGFLPFAYAFNLLYSEYARHTRTGTALFGFSFVVWALYGVAAFLPFVQKNTMYNVLDVFAKNAYGLFLYFFLQGRQKAEDLPLADPSGLLAPPLSKN